VASDAPSSPERRRGLGIELVAPPAVLLLAILAIVLATGPRSGRYSGSAPSDEGPAESALPVSFTLNDRRLASLALGPARVSCSSGASGKATRVMPKLTGFPVERLTAGSAGEYAHGFVRRSGSAFEPASAAAARPQGSLYVRVSGVFESGTKFISRGGIQIRYSADANGAPDPDGPLSCNGSWDGTLAKRG
jgi:hypothetical protein